MIVWKKNSQEIKREYAGDDVTNSVYDTQTLQKKNKQNVLHQ